MNEADMELLCDYYGRVERQGPGSPESSRKALRFVEGLSETSRIADIGCGTGGQTLTLAESAPGFITGVDFLSPFIDVFNRNFADAGMSDRARGVVGSMDALDFAEEELDLIWSEGAIYNIGFERGLNTWRPFLKPGGYIAVSEISWLTEERPDEINDFWNAAYPEIDTVAHKVDVMERSGFEVVGSFTLPASDWLARYYEPLEGIALAFLADHANSDAARALVDEQRAEAELYRRFKEFYSYGFYVGKLKREP